jgi:AcrR family transcriptional regulator
MISRKASIITFKPTKTQTIKATIKKVTPQHVRRQQTESAVLTSAENLFVRNGFNRTTVDDIAKAAGLTKGSIYLYFEDKRDVLLVLLRRANDRVLVPILTRLDSPQKPVIDKLVEYINSWARVAIDQRNTMFLPILMSFEFHGTNDPVDHLISDMYSRNYISLARVLEMGRTTGVLSIDGDVTEYAAVVISFMDGLLLEWLRRGGYIDGEKMTRAARKFMLSGLIVNSNNFIRQ